MSLAVPLGRPVVVPLAAVPAPHSPAHDAFHLQPLGRQRGRVQVDAGDGVDGDFHCSLTRLSHSAPTAPTKGNIQRVPRLGLQPSALIPSSPKSPLDRIPSGRVPTHRPPSSIDL